MDYDKKCIEQLKEINKLIQEINDNLRKELQNYKDSKKKLLISFDSGNEFIIKEQ